MISASLSRRDATLGIACAILAALGFSAKAVMVKFAYVYSVDALTLLVLRMAFSLPFFLVMVVWFALVSAGQALTARDWWTVGVLGLLGYYLSSLLDFMGLQYISASLERLVVFLYPTLVVVLAAIFMDRPITRRTLLALALSYAGIVLVFGWEMHQGMAGVLEGTALVFASVVTFAVYLLGSDGSIRRLGAMRFSAYAMTVSCVATGVHYGLALPMTVVLHQPLPVYGWALAMALFSTVAPALLMAEGIRRLGAGPTSVIGSIGPVFTLVMAWAWLGETLSLMQVAGAVLVVGGVLAVSLGKQG